MYVCERSGGQQYQVYVGAYTGCHVPGVVFLAKAFVRQAKPEQFNGKLSAFDCSTDLVSLVCSTCGCIHICIRSTFVCEASSLHVLFMFSLSLPSPLPPSLPPTL